MNTIFWVSAVIALVTFAKFALNINGYRNLRIDNPDYVRVAELHGHSFIGWRWLFVGVIAFVVAVTV